MPKGGYEGLEKLKTVLFEYIDGDHFFIRIGLEVVAGISLGLIVGWTPQAM